MNAKRCSHGKTFMEPCIECKLIMAREGLRWATESVEKYNKRIAELEAELSVPHPIPVGQRPTDTIDSVPSCGQENDYRRATTPAQAAQASPQEVQEACAQIADRTALRCVREQIPGDATATYIARAIRALIPPAVSSTGRGSPFCSQCTGKGFVVRDSAVDGPYTINCPSCTHSSTEDKSHG